MSKRILTNALFRQQAIDEQKNRLHGDVILTQPVSFTLIIITVFLAVLVITALLIDGTYARRESVSGYLVPDKGVIKIYAPIKGVLSKIHVKERQNVSKNELLFSISTIQNNAQGSDRDALLLNELEQQLANVQTKIVQERLLKESKITTAKNSVIGTKRELSQLELSISLQEKQLKFSATNISKLKKLLTRGHISESTVQNSQQDYLEKEVRFQSLQRQKIQLQNQYNQLVQQKAQLPLEWQSRLTDLNKNIFDIEQAIVEISGRRNYSIRAPVSGQLAALQISEGQTLNTLAPLIAIIPEGTQLQAALFLPTRAAGFISKGQQVLLRYGAFPYQHYGLHKGKVSEVAQVILSPNELPIPVTLNEPVYRVRVAIDNQFVSAYGKAFSLQAGMLLDADIVLEKRTLAQWLLAPIYGLSGRL